MQVCTSLQTDNHASTPPLYFFTGRTPFLLPNQQRQSTGGTITEGSFLGSKWPTNAFVAGALPRLRWGSLQRSPDLLAGLTGPTSKGRRRERGMGEMPHVCRGIKGRELTELRTTVETTTFHMQCGLCSMCVHSNVTTLNRTLYSCP